MAGTYLTLGAMHVAGGDPRDALVHVVAAVVTFGFAAAVLPIMAPRRRGEGGPDDRGAEGDGDEPPPPPWWPEFEREFWGRVNDADPARHREAVGAVTAPRPGRE